MNIEPSERLPPGTRWTAEQVMAWMDSFRDLILSTEKGDQPYDRVRRADPMRQIFLPTDRT